MFKVKLLFASDVARTFPASKTQENYEAKWWKGNENEYDERPPHGGVYPKGFVKKRGWTTRWEKRTNERREASNRGKNDDAFDRYKRGLLCLTAAVFLIKVYRLLCCLRSQHAATTMPPIHCSVNPHVPPLAHSTSQILILMAFIKSHTKPNTATFLSTNNNITYKKLLTY